MRSGGIVTQADLLETIAGDIPEVGEGPDVVEREDGSLLLDSMMPARQVVERLTFAEMPDSNDFTTQAGYVIQLGWVPGVGDAFDAGEWRFEVVDMDGRRIHEFLVGRAV